jgi:hypothetical protein
MKICGWKDLKTMQRYIRLAGIDEAGGAALHPDGGGCNGESRQFFSYRIDIILFLTYLRHSVAYYECQ